MKPTWQLFCLNEKNTAPGDNIWYFIAMVLLGTPAHVYPWCFTGIFIFTHHNSFASVVVGARQDYPCPISEAERKNT